MPPARRFNARRLSFLLLCALAILILLKLVILWWFQPSHTAALEQGYDISLVGNKKLAQFFPSITSGFRADVRIESVDQAGDAEIFWRTTVGKNERVIVGKLTGNLSNSLQAYLPLQWWPGNWKTQSSLLWLSKDAFSQLKSNGTTRWQSHYGNDWGWFWPAAFWYFHGPPRIELTALNFDVPFSVLTLAGKARVNAILARDSNHNRYWILDNPEDPLILKFIPQRINMGFMIVDGIFIWTPLNYLFDEGYHVTAMKNITLMK